MRIFRNPDDFIPPEKPVVTIGTFDGVHAGHQRILEHLNQTAQKINGHSVLVTFWPHPRLVLHPDQKDLRLLNTIDEKQELLEKFGLDYLLMIPFSRKFAAIDKHEFIQKIILNTLQTKVLIVGYDHRFGKNREGSFADLQEAASNHNFKVEEIAAQTIKDITVSSTRIRKALFSGDVETANHYLCYPYFLTGKVMHGRHLGRKIKFPTANIRIEETYKLIPADGVYIVNTEAEGKIYQGMLNIGTRPTVNGKQRTIEVNLFDFNGNLYEKIVRVFLLKRLRAEEDFESLELLQKQLEKDKQSAREYFRNTPDRSDLPLMG